jgi:prolyl-tRNA synthetase
MATNNKAITKRADDYSQWYLDIIEAAELAENSEVRGCIVFKPYGYALWENIQKELDRMIKETGHDNVYFPLFIPKSYLEKEEKHASGFAKECAVVTHYRLISDGKGGLMVDPKSKLEEELIIRPTSETIINKTLSKWLESYRDLPIKLNQWANVVRWEMRTRPFLRTAEFLWQEGHTIHETHEEAQEEVMKMLDVYTDLAENYLAMSVVKGEKSETERFAGADNTYSIEALMQDGKALQSGTSHDLGQNFTKAFDTKFADKEGATQFAWQTSWGLSTRIIGGLIMTHSDDKGLVLPPKIAPIKVVIIPIWKTDDEQKQVLAEVQKLEEEFKASGIDYKADNRDHLTPGHKFNEWEKKGVPVRLEIGPKDIANDEVVLARRDTDEKMSVARKELVSKIEKVLADMQKNLHAEATKFREANTIKVDSYDEFKSALAEKPRFILAHWDGTKETEAKIAEETKATIRNIPFDSPEEIGKDMISGKPSAKRALFAIAY